ncbi:MAG: nicotinamide riboside transporter PnuC [Bacteroidales bacterium]
MLLSLLFETLQENLLETSWIELIAVLFGLFSVWFARQENILVYPTGIISVAIFVYICFDVQLYADAGIYLFYFIMSIYGWIMWSKKSDVPPLRISSCNRKDWLFSVGFFAISAGVIYLLLVLFKKNDAEYWMSAVPYIDIFTTAIFVVAMLLMAMKKIEHWILWIVGDVVSVPLYAHKGLVLTGFQFFVFLLIAVAGYMAWKKKLEAMQNPDHPEH